MIDLMSCVMSSLNGVRKEYWQIGINLPKCKYSIWLQDEF